MPTYEYACTSCGQHLEAVQSFTDEPLTTCAICGGPMRKVFGAIGIVLKGSGFYKNDSRPAHSAKSGGDKDGGSSKKSDGEAPKASPAKEAASGGSSEGSGSSSSGAPAAGSGGSGSPAAKAATP